MSRFVDCFARAIQCRSRRSPEVVGSFDNLQLIGNNRGRSITNKAGRAVLRVKLEGAFWKMYEAHSPAHSNFITALSRRLPKHFPPIRETRGQWVVASWVEGDISESVRIDHHVALLRSVHEVPPSDLPEPSFRYWNDYIVPRFERAACFFGEFQIAQEFIRRAEASECRPVVMHPDLTPANLVIGENGELQSIDNELVCIDFFPLLDVCNAIRPLDTRQRRAFSAAWLHDTPLSDAEKQAVAYAWLVREIGSAFVSGEFKKAYQLLHLPNMEVIEMLPLRL